MDYKSSDRERQRRLNRIRRKKERAREIRRHVCILAIAVVLAGCIIGGAFAGIYNDEKAEKAQEADFYVFAINAPAHTYEETQNTPLQIAGVSEEQTEAGQQDKPVFVCLPAPMSEEDQKIVFDICTENGVAFSLVMAIIEHESNFTREARSATGDSGYMQINDCNAAEMERRGFVDMYDTKQNVGAGVSILHDLFNAYGDEVHRVLMAYNMGRNNADKLWQQGIESSEYSREIVEREAEYSRYMDKYLKGN